MVHQSKTISIHIFDSIFLKPRRKYNIWHTTSQLSKRIPTKNIKLVYTIHDLNFLYSNKANWKKKRELLKIKRNIRERFQFDIKSKKENMRKIINIFEKYLVDRSMILKIVTR